MVKKAVVITVAGISGRFNEDIPEADKKLKALYYEGSSKDTLLYHLLRKCSYADRILIVGGYQFETLKDYCFSLEPGLRDKIMLVYNAHFRDLSSGYSLYLGLKEAFREPLEEVLFVEGDLDIDEESFMRVVRAKNNVLTYNYEAIYADKAVVLYQDEKGKYRYVFNQRHGMLSIPSPFSCILHSGQTWKFTDIEMLQAANEKFYEKERDGTNLRIIQNCLDSGAEVDLIGLKRWTNCNTRADYQKILSYWEDESK